VAWSAFVGYQAASYLAYELAYWDLGRFESPIQSSFDVTQTLLGIKEWSLSARFSYPFSKEFYADWYIGISRATFDVEDRFLVSGVLPFTILPSATPDDETGIIWGFGFTWQFLEKFGVSLDYRQHNVQVQDMETINLALLFSL